MRLLDRFPALSHRDFRLLWLGQIVSITGSQMQAVTIIWQLSEKTRDPAIVGTIGLVRVIPVILFSMIGGMVADTYDRRRIMFISQGAMMLAAIVLGTLESIGELDVPLILAMTALTAGAGAFDNPARQSLIPNLVPSEHLLNAVSLNTMTWQTAMILGPAVAGLMIETGYSTVYLINATTFLAVIGALAAMRLEHVATGVRGEVSLEAMKEGLRFVRSNKLILSTMLLDFFATFFSSATALLPFYARDILQVGAKGFGVLSAAEAVGSLVAGTVMSTIGEIRRKGKVLLASVALYGLATVLFGLSETFVVALLMLALVGAGDAVSTVLRNTIRQLATPDSIRGRMTGVNMIFFMGGPQLGNLEAGLMAKAIGTQLSVITGGIATVVTVGITAVLFPKLVKYGESRTENGERRTEE